MARLTALLPGIYTQHPKMAPADGIERCEDRSRRYNLTGRALVITTSHGVLGDENCTSCKKTGVASPEFTIPYYIFQDAGMEVSLLPRCVRRARCIECVNAFGR